jgi:hypothetical protein
VAVLIQLVWNGAIVYTWGVHGADYEYSEG